MTEARRVEAIECPGFDAIDATHKTCGQLSRDRERPNIIRADQEMCDRCRRQKSKYDEENGARQRREAEDQLRYEALVAAYVDDLGKDTSWTMLNLGSLLEAIGRLKGRSSYPPYDVGFRTDDVSCGVTLAILRSLANLPIGRRSGRF